MNRSEGDCIMVDSKIVTLLTVANIGSYTKAAAALSLSQPAVSHHIRQLEEEFGITIFYKDKKSLKTTPEGEILIKFARRAVALSSNVRKAIEDSKRSVRTLSIGTTPTAEENLVMHIFAAYCNAHPGVHINIVTDTIQKLDLMLKAYEVDLAIVEGNLADDRYVSVLLDTDYLCLAVSPKHPFARRKSVTLSDMMRENFILRQPGAGTRIQFENNLLRHGESIKNFNVIMELDNVAIIKELVASNLGITIISKKACRAEFARGKLVGVPIENFSMTREINIVCQHDFNHPEILEEIRRTYDGASREYAQG